MHLLTPFCRGTGKYTLELRRLCFGSRRSPPGILKWLYSQLTHALYASLHMQITTHTFCILRALCSKHSCLRLISVMLLQAKIYTRYQSMLQLSNFNVAIISRSVVYCSRQKPKLTICIKWLFECVCVL